MLATSISAALSSLRHRFIHHADQSNLPSLIRQAVAVRLVVWLAMAVASQLFTHDAEGVVTYPLPSSASVDRCFAYAGSWCDCGSSCNWTNVVSSPTCAIPLQRQHKNSIQEAYTVLLMPLTRWDAARFLRLALHPQLRVPPPRGGASFDESEQAHAFLPLYPQAIQCAAQLLLAVVPASFLPVTCEETLVLAAYGLNTVSFVASVVMLFLLSSELLGDQRLARRTTLFFVINPAGVFFQSSYSEALFAALVFSGCYLVALSRRRGRVPGKILLAAVCWWLAAWTRSNGTLYFGFLLLWGLAHAVHRRSAIWLLPAVLVVLLLCQSTLSLHNLQGYYRHCSSSSTTTHPEWCSSGPSFNLYTHVQRQHWNVGLFRYYQWKQIPNFLLAAPVLSVAFGGVVIWIAASWERSNASDPVTWVLVALRDSVVPMPTKAPPTHSAFDLCYGPSLLPHYAILAAAALLGLLVAHVQISTRLLCSTCPALYWHMAAVASNPSSATLGGLLVAWCLLYTVLGIVLHSTWLPWT